MTELNFDSTKYEEMRSYSVIPKDDYPMEIVSSEKKETKAKDGFYLSLEIAVISGPHKGARVWARLNLWNKNQQAVDIANKELTSICRAVGILKPKQSEHLHKIPFIGSVKVTPAQGDWPEKNEMTGYKPYDESAINIPQAEEQSAPVDNDQPESLPWEEKKSEPSAEVAEDAFDEDIPI